MESSGSRTLVIIPTYQEAENIRSVLLTVMGLPGELSVLVVDDGSPDGTREIVSETVERFPDRICLIERGKKLGLGTAYLEGFEYALRHGYDLVCEMDADLSHNPADLPRLIEPVAADRADLVIGSRYIEGVRIINWPLSRLILSYSAGIYTRLITRLPIRDVTSGFKCIHRRVLEAIPFESVRSNGYSFQIEINYRAWKKGFRLLEVPIVFTERTEGQSKMSKAIVHEAMFKVWELRLRSLFRRL
ncbi:MAG: polyprenol monophosphomannose synthase [Bacteroidetes bacterium]|nr:polyprenol monophosphomannose synthase [Bacteroidota bacterium]